MIQPEPCKLSGAYWMKPPREAYELKGITPDAKENRFFFYRLAVLLDEPAALQLLLVQIPDIGCGLMESRSDPGRSREIDGDIITRRWMSAPACVLELMSLPFKYGRSIPIWSTIR
ncbi:hypothetical protein KP806_12275 [Paenibacillus sp. N4]|uniref:hypothetical protein n=1 Tax=Paenibacillus vietnamensis TaxID=2590547 RepID=UPI001CD0E209|nr:hypothetical protein [Paenibacillus vietnamensis]MCA0755826.1 hypothetical protein [Paenibacillus vietnamensis]